MVNKALFIAVVLGAIAVVLAAVAAPLTGDERFAVWVLKIAGLTCFVVLLSRRRRVK